jgi:hypothetical protein
MNDTKRQSPPAKQPPSLHTLMYYSGVAILFIGLLGAELIYYFTTDDDAAELAGQLTRVKAYEHNVQVIGGNFSLYAARLGEWFSGLWQGRELAYTVAVLSVAIAAACFVLAYLASKASRADAQRSR